MLVRGYLDSRSPHSINHMIVGSLGQEEIVLTCHDDGDVVAFYTKDIAECILAKADLPSSAMPEQRRASMSTLNTGNVPKPFFHENVGISAWGLAVHQKSRLIAVSSNRFEVTVFAPALATNESRSSRDCDFVSLGPLADNIPNISFVDDKYGNAEKISAIDIKGAMWLANIWKASQAAIRVMPSNSQLLKSEEFWPAASRGWGILALPNSSFLPVETEEELLGAAPKDLELVPKLQAGPHPVVNMAKALQDLPDNPCAPPPIRPHVTRVQNQPAEGLEVVADIWDDALASGHVSDDDESEFGESEPGEGTEADDDLEAGVDLELEGEEGEGEDDAEVFYNMPITGGTAAPSDVPPELADQAEETNMEQEIEHANTTASPYPAEGSVALQNLFTDLFSSPIRLDPESDGTSDGYLHRPPPSSECLKLRSNNNPATCLDMIYTPHSGKVFRISRHRNTLAAFLMKVPESNENTAGYVTGLGGFAERYHMLRTYEKDMEMRSLDKARQRGLPEMGMLCPNALTMGLTPGRFMTPHFRATSRLNMVLHIPELSLVVIGSPIGRVLLVTPTRLVKPIEKLSGLLHYGLRIDWVLPRQSDEAVFRVNKRPLHGMAVGPVQEDGVLGDGDEKRRVAAPRRYRLMLHYRNHDILTYEISREEQTAKLCIF
ncbi:hypothetical protein ED733_005483 [Metarhizium rileyi]|uniref:Pyridine nucleotide-disulfide oxidoreductase family protein n=1 Tax=Metarhizium rileyi (strain RCEF 4871) TaxID=1649241 RepID=A0A5C6GE09_METRR|nr:hypothetical protein ED733_005483 [Metarhizium rileyi]